MPIDLPPRTGQRSGGAGSSRATRGARSAQEQAEGDVEALSYTVSHDLRSPLGAILNFSTLLREEYADKLDDDARDWLQRIERNAHHAVAMMDSLLAYSRVGRRAIEPSAVNLEHVFRTALVENFSEEQRAEIRLHIDEIPPVHGDLDLLTQLAAELLRNVSTFAVQDGAVDVTISSAHSPDGDVLVTFRDSGPGFAAGDPESAFGLFQRFHRASEHKAPSQGLGTGLATVKRIVERHGGTVHLVTAPGEGTAISFDLESADDTPADDMPNERGTTTDV